jgi:hypothetical protein
LFQYQGASPWSNNTIRYCVSINDAHTTKGSGSVFIWNGSDNGQQLNGCNLYNNVFYNPDAPLVSFDNSSEHKNFTFINNIFLGSDHPIAGTNKGSKFIGNDWWNTKAETQFMGFDSLADWAKATGQEILNGNIVGIHLDPLFTGPMITDITDPYKLDKLYGFTLQTDSPLRDKGLDIKSVLGIEQATTDFFGNLIHSGTGAEPGIYEIK